ncbi:MAG: MerR family DNA-binding transcriptional regulator [Oceanospirillaceae bacterium]|nr:MerR family DNA-binding transcriptional regulator [Oceanospirillaceae bacterium]NRB42801.1 MerR family DNA-binding transcriptional regulator [Pseudomonadales bacterium]
MTEATTYSISELAAEFDLTTRSIRFYEDQQLLAPTRRGQTRIYSRQDRVQLKLILRGKRLGFSLLEIKELFDLWDATSGGSEKQLRLLHAKIAERKVALQLQQQDIKLWQLELDNAQQRCEEALLALQQ